MKRVEATPPMVIRGFYDLYGKDPHADGVAAEAIADYLEASVESVETALRELTGQRLLRDRRRRGRRVWEPWTR